MPNSENERVIFENWEDEGCHIFAGGKCVLTLNTPESTSNADPYIFFVEDWISPEEFCANLTAVLRAFGASPAVLAEVERERRHYRESPVKAPTRSTRELLREIGVTID